MPSRRDRPKVLRISNPAPSVETIKLLQELLEQAEAGALVGVACVAVYVGSEYYTYCVGEASLAPAATRGMVGELLDEISEMQRALRARRR